VTEIIKSATKKKVIRASQLGHCKRELILNLLGIIAVDPQSFEASFGTLIHNIIQAELKNRGYPVEVSHYREDLRLEGTIDAIIDDKIIEFKTTSYADGFFNQSSRQWHNLKYQLGAYSLLTNLSKAEVYVIDVSSIRKNALEFSVKGVNLLLLRNGAEIPIRKMEIEITDHWREVMEMRIREIWEGVEKKELPPPPQNTEFWCKFCSFKGICEDEELLNKLELTETERIEQFKNSDIIKL
jgi:CRISPR/Cas system-associated exonuclease Cas4 (RecB family)